MKPRLRPKLLRPRTTKNCEHRDPRTTKPAAADDDRRRIHGILTFYKCFCTECYESLNSTATRFSSCWLALCDFEAEKDAWIFLDVLIRCAGLSRDNFLKNVWSMKGVRHPYFVQVKVSIREGLTQRELSERFLSFRISSWEIFISKVLRILWPLFLEKAAFTADGKTSSSSSSLKVFL